MIMKYILLLNAFYITFCIALQCNEPKFSDIETFVTKDSKVNTETTYVAQFRLTCSNYAKNVPLYTEIDGKFLTTSSSEAGDVYQISWSENHKGARTGQIVIKIYDEEGFSDLKRAQRNNEDINKVKELTKITLNHSGNYRGPYIQIELLIAILFSSIFYWAYSNRSNIQS